jgi:hypothetical protein
MRRKSRDSGTAAAASVLFADAERPVALDFASLS